MSRASVFSCILQVLAILLDLSSLSPFPSCFSALRQIFLYSLCSAVSTRFFHGACWSSHSIHKYLWHRKIWSAHCSSVSLANSIDLSVFDNILLVLVLSHLKSCLCSSQTGMCTIWMTHGRAPSLRTPFGKHARMRANKIVPNMILLFVWSHHIISIGANFFSPLKYWTSLFVVVLHFVVWPKINARQMHRANYSAANWINAISKDTPWTWARAVVTVTNAKSYRSQPERERRSETEIRYRATTADKYASATIFVWFTPENINSMFTFGMFLERHEKKFVKFCSARSTFKRNPFAISITLGGFFGFLPPPQSKRPNRTSVTQDTPYLSAEMDTSYLWFRFI